jgi:hypothetical protein
MSTRSDVEAQKCLGRRLMPSAEKEHSSHDCASIPVFGRAAGSRYPITRPRQGLLLDPCPISALLRPGLSAKIFPQRKSGWSGLSRHVSEDGLPLPSSSGIDFNLGVLRSPLGLARLQGTCHVVTWLLQTCMGQVA